MASESPSSTSIALQTPQRLPLQCRLGVFRPPSKKQTQKCEKTSDGDLRWAITRESSPDPSRDFLSLGPRFTDQFGSICLIKQDVWE